MSILFKLSYVSSQVSILEKSPNFISFYILPSLPELLSFDIIFCTYYFLPYFFFIPTASLLRFLFSKLPCDSRLSKFSFMCGLVTSGQCFCEENIISVFLGWHVRNGKQTSSFPQPERKPSSSACD